MAYRMPFGKHKGLPLHELPDGYLDWLMTLDLRRPLHDHVQDEWNQRHAVLPDQSRECDPLTRGVIHEILRVGYKQLAMRDHPDVGGTHEAMARLNQAIQLLRVIVSEQVR